ncbi:hypothetical protein CFC21_043097 [Triticum aestivum]|uniref:Uncharacterized protein n=3 Tax=Triticum TaxID=4564 RepID=A0A9R1S622_TRITD|nr:hypothetical protein CFC21_043097 [Triticum aestivum]CDJ26340.1 unnamed protein product [Triticum aestivum]VAH82402.1 unnamed protein product [Triticum turgidum subsp. durum]
MVIDSLPFMVGGHRWDIRYYPNGRTSENADYVSIYLHLLDEDVAEFKVLYEFSFVDQRQMQDSAHIRGVQPTNFSDNHRCWGYPNFAKRDALEKSNHLNDDCFTIRCDLTIASTVDLFIKVPTSCIQHHISDLLQSEEEADVTFKIGDDTFVAHRCVLAARSTVFRAELFGPMKEGTIGGIIHIEDMEGNVFKALLSFIYTDSLPKMAIDTLEDEREDQEVLWLQHLLEAADRYDLERLKVLCEEKLCQHIDVGSVTTILTLAEQHNCSVLKEVCFQFLKTPANLKKIVAVDGLEDITRTCPSLLKMLIAKLVCL